MASVSYQTNCSLPELFLRKGTSRLVYIKGWNVALIKVERIFQVFSIMCQSFQLTNWLDSLLLKHHNIIFHTAPLILYQQTHIDYSFTPSWKKNLIFCLIHFGLQVLMNKDDEWSVKDRCESLCQEGKGCLPAALPAPYTTPRDTHTHTHTHTHTSYCCIHVLPHSPIKIYRFIKHSRRHCKHWTRLLLIKRTTNTAHEHNAM